MNLVPRASGPPEPTAMANNGYPLPGYVWVDINGRATHRLETQLEFRHSNMAAG